MFTFYPKKEENLIKKVRNIFLLDIVKKSKGNKLIILRDAIFDENET